MAFAHEAITESGPERSRPGRTFYRIVLSTTLIRTNELDVGVDVARDVINEAQHLRSGRGVSRLAEIATAALRSRLRRGRPDAPARICPHNCAEGIDCMTNLTAELNQRLKQALKGICQEAGLLADEAELIKYTNNAVYRLPSQGVVVRFGAGDLASERADHVARIASWLQGNDAAAARLVPGLTQPVLFEWVSPRSVETSPLR